jgi:hypothetical protein
LLRLFLALNKEVIRNGYAGQSYRVVGVSSPLTVDAK